ncbi:hypothetical protein JS756_08745 [Streptomyces actuosus]|uniref:Uncharacterized protein n=1 Tax=Streptomyces actuosus TaxID=1885 RepID=A0ABS2VMB6_STRAS|nr:hypothetical protein [Streptomyces actuosus]MBN0044194.1 hypothetical protein [Streptomyces actuosus]
MIIAISPPRAPEPSKDSPAIFSRWVKNDAAEERMGSIPSSASATVVDMASSPSTSSAQS